MSKNIDYIDTEKIADQTVFYYNRDEKFAENSFIAQLADELKSYFSQLQLLAEAEEMDEHACQNEIVQLVERLQTNFKKLKREEIIKQLAEAEKNKDQQKIDLLSQEFLKYD